MSTQRVIKIVSGWDCRERAAAAANGGLHFAMTTAYSATLIMTLCWAVWRLCLFKGPMTRPECCLCFENRKEDSGVVLMVPYHFGGCDS